MDTEIFNCLNNNQRQAVFYNKGASIILAGAGSGKTRVLVYKVIYLVKELKVNPDSIVMITFTNKAASEMKKRIYGLMKKNLGFIGTFHSFCVRVLRRHGDLIGLSPNFIIYDEDDQISLIKKILKKTDAGRFTPTYFLNRISAAKNQLIGNERYLSLFSDFNASLTADVYKKYEKELSDNQAVDFDDLIVKTIKLFLKHEEVLDKYHKLFRYFLVDEFQDTNYAQYKLIKLLGEKYGQVSVVGDFSQSIYSWRGADIGNLENFKKDLKNNKIFYLEENYRSTQKILDLAYQVISKNQGHPILNLYTKNKQGSDVVYHQTQNEEDEGRYITEEIIRIANNDQTALIKPGTIAVLYRTNAQSRALEEVFLHYGLAYVLIGGTRFYERKEIKDVLAYLRLLLNPVEVVSLDRVKKIGKKRFDLFKKYYLSVHKSLAKKTTVDLMEEIFGATGYLALYSIDSEEDYSRLENIKELKSVAVTYPDLNDFLEQIALVESEYSEGEKKNKRQQGVTLMTLHQAKGLEFDHVFISGVEEGILPHSRSIDDYFQLEEERRLFYVGITRAKKSLHITFTRRRFIFGRRYESMPSRFLEGVNDI
jgi:DNA helicase-2/ATP-dependent DNA helicase PcrA